MPVFLSKPLYLAECVNVKFHCYHCYKEENYDKDTEIRHGLYFASLTGVNSKMDGTVTKYQRFIFDRQQNMSLTESEKQLFGSYNYNHKPF